MKTCIYTYDIDKAHHNNFSDIHNIDLIQFNPDNYYGSWDIKDIKNNVTKTIDKRKLSIFINHILEYILYYQDNDDKLWDYKICVNEYLICFEIYLDIHKLITKLENKLEKKHNYLIYLLSRTIKYENECYSCC